MRNTYSRVGPENPAIMKRLVVIPRAEQARGVRNPSGEVEKRKIQRRLGLARRTRASRREDPVFTVEPNQERRHGSDRRRAVQRRKVYDRRIGLGRRFDLSDWDL